MCNCIALVGAELAKNNSTLETGFTFGTEARPGYEFPTLTTKKIDKRSRTKMGAIPSFCPFCGVSYRADELVSRDIAPDASRPSGPSAPSHSFQIQR